MRNVIMSTAALLLAASSAPALAAPGDYRIVRSFPAPQVSPDGLEWDGQYLWSTECQSDTNFKLDPASGETVAQSRSSGIMVDHFAWDGTSMWGSHAHTNMVHRFDATVSQSLEMFSAPTTVMGIAWDGAMLWLLDPDGKAIYRWENGQRSATASFSTPGNNPCGLGWDGQCLWAGDLTTQKFYQIDPATGDITLTIDTPGGPGRLPTGFTWDGQYAWIADEDPGNPTLYQLDIEFLADGPCGHSTTTDSPTGTGDVCACDRTYACDDSGSEACACDPECTDSGGCSATPVGWFLGLAGAIVLLRRRRASSQQTNNQTR